ncbi:MAG: MBG domain-containing protein [Verrucomicrobiota bacterium]
MKLLQNLLFAVLVGWLLCGSALAIDTNPPVILAPGDITVEATSARGIAVSDLATATDDVGVASLVFSAKESFSIPNGVAVDGSGNVYVADTNNNTIRKITKGGVVSTLAGSAGVYGSADGTGSAARFANPRGVAVDGSGNVYVTDNSTIRKITSGGVVSTFAGSAGVFGSVDGPGSAARFSDPTGVAVDGNGSVYVADSYNSTIRKVTSGGVVSTIAGSAGVSGSADGTGSAARFNYPTGVAVDGSGNVYVADNSTIRIITRGGVVRTVAGSAGVSGSADGTGSAASFGYPLGVAVDGSGNVYVADSGNHTIRKITSDGVVSTLAGSAGVSISDDGTGSAASFVYPRGVAVDGSGNVYVADNSTIRKITSGGVVSTLAGSPDGNGRVNGTGSAARFANPTCVAVDGSWNVYVADTDNKTIRKITKGGVVSTLAGKAGLYGSADGTGSAARFAAPRGVAVDGNGNVYVTDYRTIRKITSGGVVSTLAGSADESGSEDGIGSAARFVYLTGVAVDGNGNLYVADNSTIRKITSGGAVSTLAGRAGVYYETVDGTGGDARFRSLGGIAVDGSGNVYVTDGSTIRKITSGGAVSTLAGSAGESGSTDGTGSAARFFYPTGVAVDGSGNLYVADNSTIRKITSGGVVSTLAGSAGVSGSADGTGSAARFDHPTGVAVDGSGNVYVADTNNHTIRRTTSGGVVNTLAGSAGSNYGSQDTINMFLPFGATRVTATTTDTSGNLMHAIFNVTVVDTTAPTIGVPSDITVSAESVNGAVVNYSVTTTDNVGVTSLINSVPLFSAPKGLAVDGSGNVYVADSGNRAIRKITRGGVVSTTARSAGCSDETGSPVFFGDLSDVAVDGSGDVYVADSGNHTIRKITKGGVVSTLAGSENIYGSVDGTGSAARFADPRGVALDGSGNVYVADSGNHTIRKITSGGVVSTLAGSAGVSGSADGIGSAARFGYPTGVAVDGSGNVYVADTGINTIRKITSGGVVSTLAGSTGLFGSADGTGSAARFVYPNGIAVDGSGNVYVADTGNATIRKITKGGVVSTLAGSANVSGSADGIGRAARFVYPTGVAVDGSGNVYVTETYTHTIRKITRGGVVSTLAGSAGVYGSADGFVNPTSGATFPIGTTQVTLRASDAAGNTRTTSFNVTVTKMAQTMTFAALANRLSNAEPFTLTASASSKLPVSFTLTGPAMLDGSTVTLTGVPGIVSITASQEGDATYAAATSVTREFSVMGTQSIHFPQPAPATYGDAPITLNASATSFLPVVYEVVSGPATVLGATLSITGAGLVVIRASQEGDLSYTAAADVSRTLVVAKKTLTVSIPSQSRLVGLVNPKFGMSYVGFVGSDTESVLEKKPTVATTATANSQSGTYPITISGGSDANYTFAVTSGATLSVLGFGGSYEALLFDGDENPIGKLDITVSRNTLQYSGKLTLSTEAKASTLTGTLVSNAEGTSANSTLLLTRKFLPTLKLEFAVSGEVLTASLARSGLSTLDSGSSGARLYSVPTKTTASWTGSYTLLSRGATSWVGGSRDYARGASYAAVKVAPATGVMTLVGKMADGTLLTGALPPDASGRYRLFLKGGRLNSYVSGVLALKPHPDVEGRYYIPLNSEESGLVWSSVGLPSDISYRAGFGPLSLRVSLDPWSPPVAGSAKVGAVTLAQRLGLVQSNTGSGILNVSYGSEDHAMDLGLSASALAAQVSMNTKAEVNVLTPQANTDSWTVKMTPLTGLFTGSFTLKESGEVKRSVTFSGILRQGPVGDVTVVGAGYFLLQALPGASTTEQPSLEIQLSAPAP